MTSWPSPRLQHKPDRLQRPPRSADGHATRRSHEPAHADTAVLTSPLTLTRAFPLSVSADASGRNLWSLVGLVARRFAQPIEGDLYEVDACAHDPRGSLRRRRCPTGAATLHATTARFESDTFAR